MANESELHHEKVILISSKPSQTRLAIMASMKACAPYICMVVCQFASAGSSILNKLALEQGLSMLVFVVYRHLIAVIILAPLAYVLERNQRPCFSFAIMLKIFILAMVGITIQQNVYYVGLHFTSPTVAVALSNVIPAFTFILAMILRMEKLSLKTARGRTKLGGAIFCIAGALVFIFWKGHLLGVIVRRPLVQFHFKSSKKGDDWLRGSALILTSCFAGSAKLILQAFICQIYPARLTMNTLVCFFASLQSSALALVFERNASSWRMNWNIQLMAIIYGGTVISCLVYYLQIYCISKKGPVFCSIFAPLAMLIVAFVSAFIFAERLHVGSLIGASIIILGLYCFLWGKSGDSVEEGDKDCGAQRDSEAEMSPWHD
ncbi:WAT1-related protein At5g07050-like [Zingiber officinale]|uniref:WAT1-related protein At5g07050-like n=1 Tax=Zingiber officinale TaxID=94328 RepID=UPI001C4B0D63|nr:WAT1-related protein At5g07050-like [Zingiber officinale]